MGLSGEASELLEASGELKIAIVGKTKLGKSWLAATAPPPVRFLDFDDRAESLAGKPDLLIKSRPTMLDVETDLSVTKARKAKGLPIPATWVFDSVTYMNRAMEEEIFRQSPGLARTIRVGNSTSMKIRNGWDTINGIQRYMEYLIAEFSTLGNIIFIFHEKAEKDYAESTKEETAYTDQITVDPQYLSKTLSLFNEVYRMTLYGTKFLVECKQTSKFGSSTTLLLDPTEQPDIMKMIEKHRVRRAAKAVSNPAHQA
jgi:hypothetical protein